jgi:hypothetical protein
MTPTPVFIFSITRSGSTLVQRVLAAHEQVATVSEPWLLLPFLYTLKAEGVVAEYTHPLLQRAITDFCAELPDGEEDYRAELRSFVLRLYAKASAGTGAPFFLDKSPPYYFVAKEIMSLFPEGRFIFLWRNPLSIMASIVDTWLGGAWRPSAFREDLFIGLPRLVATFENSGENAMAVRFEDLLAGRQQDWRRLAAHVGFEFDPSSLTRFAEVHLNGSMGDKIGVERYHGLDRGPTCKWRGTLQNPLRVAWCRRYLRFLGAARLETMGYSQDALLRELAGQRRSLSGLAPDLGRLLADLAKEPVRARIRRGGIGGPSALRELAFAGRAGHADPASRG